MRKIKVNFADFWSSFNKEDNDFANILRERYEVEISDNPDYLFYSTFGRDYLKYDCVKIYFAGECVVPDFNLCDYAMAFEEISFGDRYHRLPLYEVFQYGKVYKSLIDNTIEKKAKTAFCSIVISNDQGMKERIQIVELLNKYKKVDSGGRFRNNVGGPVTDKMEFDRQHKFSICFENCVHPGYTTEKIMEAFAADTIPIYLGNPEIAKEFNTKAFINVADYKTLQDVISRIIEVDKNDVLYNAMKAEPILSGARKNQDELKIFLFNVFEQPLDKARRRPYNTRVEEKEEEQYIYSLYMKLFGRRYKQIKAMIRRYKNHAL